MERSTAARAAALPSTAACPFRRGDRAPGSDGGRLRGESGQPIAHPCRNPGVGDVREKVVAHARAHAVGHDRHLLESLAVEMRHRGGQPLGRFREERRIVFAERARHEHGHLHRQRGIAVVRQPAAQRADQAPVRIYPEAVHYDDAGHGLRRGRIDRKDLASGFSSSRRASPTTMAGTISSAHRCSRA